MKNLVVVTAILFMVWACGTGKENTKTSPQVASIALATTEWTLLKVKGKDGMITPSGDRLPNLLIAADNKVSGNSGCNRYFGSVTIEGTTIKFSQMGSTRMFCTEGAAIEAAVLETYTLADNYTIEGKQLTLKKGSEMLAQFTTK